MSHASRRALAGLIGWPLDVSNAVAAYSLHALSPAWIGPTCNITRTSDAESSDFTGAEIAAGAADTWLDGTTGRVSVLYDQSGEGNDAAATTGALYYRHATFGPCLQFDKTANQVYAIADDASFKTASLTLYHFSQFDTGSTNGMILGYPHNLTHTTPFYRWNCYEETATGKIATRIATTTYTSNKPNGWWRKPQVYVHEIGSAIKHRLGDYEFDAQAAAAITYPNAVGLYLGGRKGGGGELLQGLVFDLILCAGTSTTAERVNAVNVLAARRTPSFPFSRTSLHIGDLLTATGLSLDATNHPCLVKSGATYCLFFNSNPTDTLPGIYLATSANLAGPWTNHGRIIGPGAGGDFDGRIPFAVAAKLVGSAWVVWYAAQNTSFVGSIGVASNSGDLTDPDDWVKGGQIITPTFAGDLNTLDPVVYYHAAGYDPGTGDGSHPIWVMFASLETTSLSLCYKLMLANADTFGGTYTLANGGDPVSEVDGKGYPYLWPGDLVRAANGIFWKLQSYGVTTDAGYADANGRCGWTFAASLAGPWYWHPSKMEWISPSTTNDHRSIEPGLFFEDGKLHVVTATDSDATSAARERVTHYRSYEILENN